ncbi:gamma-type small acid-soluble spore protein [Bacillus anthracis]|uniref:gamma-type small acid-soluble spore protein n=1 Tax=Bacillus anthracis TaxID=1392 RepID=UPI0006977A87|nr:gamma-type small acid-soluble spore protein [Bacillus anthracis]
MQSTNASYGTEFATETNVQAVKQANAQSEAKKAQASGASIQSTNASYGTEFATETDVHAVKKQNAQSAAKQSQSSSSNQ